MTVEYRTEGKNLFVRVVKNHKELGWSDDDVKEFYSKVDDRDIAYDELTKHLLETTSIHQEWLDDINDSETKKVLIAQLWEQGYDVNSPEWQGWEEGYIVYDFGLPLRESDLTKQAQTTQFQALGWKKQKAEEDSAAEAEAKAKKAEVDKVKAEETPKPQPAPRKRAAKKPATSVNSTADVRQESK